MRDDFIFVGCMLNDGKHIIVEASWSEWVEDRERLQISNVYCGLIKSYHVTHTSYQLQLTCWPLNIDINLQLANALSRLFPCSINNNIFPQVKPQWDSMKNDLRMNCWFEATASLSLHDSLWSNYYHNGNNLFMVINFSGSLGNELLARCALLCAVLCGVCVWVYKKYQQIVRKKVINKNACNVLCFCCCNYVFVFEILLGHLSSERRGGNS